jgi:hypothetical protein
MMTLPFVLNDVWPMLESLAIGTDNSNVVIFLNFSDNQSSGKWKSYSWKLFSKTEKWKNITLDIVLFNLNTLRNYLYKIPIKN